VRLREIDPSIAHSSEAIRQWPETLRGLLDRLTGLEEQLGPAYEAMAQTGATISSINAYITSIVERNVSTETLDQAEAALVGFEMNMAQESSAASASQSARSRVR
jgi:hypothetical protein